MRLSGGNYRLDEYLRQAEQREPLALAEFLDTLDYGLLEATYAPGGRPPDAPRALVGIILYGLLRAVASLRGLEELARLEVGCWWASGGLQPDHASLGRFISAHAEPLQAEFWEQLTRAALVRTGSGGKQLAGDGTVTQAAASRYPSLKREALEQARQEARERAKAAPEDERAREKGTASTAVRPARPAPSAPAAP